MTKQTEVEVAGIKFKGGKVFLLLTALSTLGGGAWATFEFYKDYMDMKEIVQNIDTTEINNKQEQIIIKLDEAIAYTRDIKSGLRDDILSIEKQVDRVEDKLREQEAEVRDIVANAEERFENKRDALQNDYDQKAQSLRDTTDQKIKDVEDRLNKKLQRALDNPLAN
jgi:Skp family chaperone for outer membrane proteins